MERSFDFRQLGPDGCRREQSERVLACFQKALGHELPNQLVALQGLARVLETELADKVDDESRGHLQRLAGLARRVDECVRVLAQVGRWYRDPEAASAVQLAELIDEAVAEVNLLSPGWTIRYDYEMALPLLAAPRVGLYQVVVQLLRNAARAAAPSRPLEVTIGAHRADGAVEVAVVDNGVGMAGETLKHLGEPFAGDRSPGGHGLGLFVVCQLVAGWAGKLRVATEPGQGTTVTFLVPAARTVNAHADVPPAASGCAAGVQGTALS